MILYKSTIHLGKQVKYNYNVKAERAGENERISVRTILENISAHSQRDRLYNTRKVH